MSFLNDLFDSIDKQNKQPSVTDTKTKLLDFEKMISDAARSNGMQPRSFLEQLCKNNESFAKSKLVKALLGEQDVPTQKGRDAKRDVLTPKAMHKVKQGIKQAANKQRRKMSKDAVDEMDKEDYMSKKKQLQRIQMDPNTHKDEKLKKELMRRKAELDDQAKKLGFKEDDMSTGTVPVGKKGKTKRATGINANPYDHNEGEDQPALVNAALWNMKDIYQTIMAGEAIQEDDMFSYGDLIQYLDMTGTPGEEFYDDFIDTISTAVSKAQPGGFAGQGDAVVVDKNVAPQIKTLYQKFKAATAKIKGVKEDDIIGAGDRISFEFDHNLAVETSILDIKENNILIQTDKLLDQMFDIMEAEYQGKKVQLNKPIRGGTKKFYVYVRDPKTKNIKKVSFGDTTGLSIKRDDPKRRKSFRARHNCDNPGPKTKARYWSCRMWTRTPVSKITKRKK